MSKLKPCPFCGEKPIFVQLFDFNNGVFHHTFLHRCESVVYIDQTEDETAATEQWNRRVMSHELDRGVFPGTDDRQNC